ncbi:hypothetical protein ACFQV2_26415 [Actinokineospora soli]|uniref:Uncharacterized protein n=1 Tax=Actinokineospora soli TaxID=1048753 RepID=A0ABW2TT17_9PSEU
MDNICRAVFEDSSSGFVFIDGDSVRSVTCDAAEFRGTPTWVSKRTLRQLKAGGPVDLRAHDRFCFALVVLIAVAGQERVRDLMAGAVGQPRPVDSYDDVLSALRRAWPGPRWRAFTEELAAPFAPDVLSEKNWLTADWVARLRAALTPLPPCGHPSCTPDACSGTRTDDDVPFPGEFGREVAAIRARVRTVTAATLRRKAVLDELRAMQRQVAVSRYRRTLALRVGVAVAVAGAWLVSLAVGVFG